MEIIDNLNKTLKEDLLATLHPKSKVAIAASCFSIYTFQELKEQLGVCHINLYLAPRDKTDNIKFNITGHNLNKGWQNIVEQIFGLKVDEGLILLRQSNLIEETSN